jgi:hypothetical protein
MPPRRSNPPASALAAAYEFLKTAPPKCEKCAAKLPTPEARKEHVAKTKHCLCLWELCDSYIPPGEFYSHASKAHPRDPDGQEWNDHMVAAMDRSELNDSQPWVREARWKRLDKEDKQRCKRYGQPYTGYYLEEWKKEEKQLEEWLKTRIVEVTPGIWLGVSDDEFEKRVKNGEVNEDGSLPETIWTCRLRPRVAKAAE